MKSQGGYEPCSDNKAGQSGLSGIAVDMRHIGFRLSEVRDRLRNVSEAV